MKKLQKWLSSPLALWVGLVVLIAIAAWLAIISLDSDDNPIVDKVPITFGPAVDDWVYDPDSTNILGGSAVKSYPTSLQTSHSPGVSVLAESSSFGNDNLGFAVGGANDISNFRRNIERGFLPSPDDISHEGIFYDYFFDTGQAGECQQLFCPSYVSAVSADPFSLQDEHFLAVGLNSNIKAEDFDRPDLNLVVVLDISGSMSSSLDDYYYDRFGLPINQVGESPPAEELSKMAAASQSLVALLDHLRPEDRLAIVLFDDRSYLAKPLNFVAETDLEALAGHILELEPQGGTNMELGYNQASQLLAELASDKSSGRENRIIFLTDAMPNIGDTSREGLTQLAANNADDNIYTSFIGIGVDFNTELVSSITQTKGANYHAVHSTADFKRRLDEGFNYMVTPLVFDLSLKLESEGYDIKAVYGSPQADSATGEIMRVNTLFPSLAVDGQTRGGLILLQLKQTTAVDASLSLVVDYKNRDGQSEQNRQVVDFDGQTDVFANSGIHKGIVLSRFVNVTKGWLYYEIQRGDDPVFDSPLSASESVLDNYRQEGIPISVEPPGLGYWERTSRPLQLSAAYRSIFNNLRDYLVAEIDIIGDDSLKQEIEILDLILAAPETEPRD